MIENIKKKDFTVTYKDGNNEDRMKLFFENEKVTQVRIFMKNTLSDIKNAFYVISDKHFKKKKLLFYEKHYTRNKKLVKEYYTDGAMDYYFETETDKSQILTKGYSSKGDLFSIEKITIDNRGNPVKKEKVL